MNLITTKEGKVNVSAMARKILGLEGNTINTMTADQKRDFWAVCKVFENPGHQRGKPAQKTGKGMKLIEKFVLG